MTGSAGDVALSSDVPLGPLTTYGIGGPAAAFAEVDGRRELETLAAKLENDPRPVLVIGRGSNLLVADRGFPGVVVRLGAGFDEIAVEGSQVTAGGGVALPVLARHTAALGLTGLEWAVGVPGSVGGAVRMNAGGHGSDVAESLIDAVTCDLQGQGVRRRPAGDLELGYRHSSVRSSEVVIEARFALEVGDAEASKQELSEIVRWRRAHQPGGHNAGSVFANPPGDSAGRLIEECGLKGHRVGSAAISTKHANFIQCDEGGRAADVLSLMAHVRRQVHTRFGVTLVPETRLAGFSGDEAATVLDPLGGSGPGDDLHLAGPQPDDPQPGPTRGTS